MINNNDQRIESTVRFFIALEWNSGHLVFVLSVTLWQKTLSLAITFEP